MHGRSYKAKRKSKSIQKGGSIQDTDTLLAIRDIQLRAQSVKDTILRKFQETTLTPISIDIQSSNNSAAEVETILYSQAVNKLEGLSTLIDTITIQYNDVISKLSKPYADLNAHFTKNPVTPAYTAFIAVLSLKNLTQYKENQKTLASSIRSVIEKRIILVHELSAYTFYYEHVLNSTIHLFNELSQQSEDISSYCNDLTTPVQKQETFTNLQIALLPINATKYVRATTTMDMLYTGIPYLQTDVSGNLLTDEYATPILSKLYGDTLTALFTVLPPFTETQLEYLSPEVMPVIHSTDLNNTIIPRSYKNSIISCSSQTSFAPGIILPKGALKTGDYFIVHNNQEEAALIVKIPLNDGYLPYVITPQSLTVFFYTTDTSEYVYGFYGLKNNPLLLPNPLVKYVSIDTASQIPILTTQKGTPLYDSYGYMKTMTVPQVDINGAATFDISSSVIIGAPYTGYTRFTPLHSQSDFLRSSYAVQLGSNYVFCNEHAYPILDMSGSIIQVPAPNISGQYIGYTDNETKSQQLLLLKSILQTTRTVTEVKPLLNVYANQQSADLKSDGLIIVNRCTTFYKDINDMINDYKQKETIFQNFLSADQTTQITNSIMALESSLSNLNDEKATFDSIAQSYEAATSDENYKLVNKTAMLEIVKIESMFSLLSEHIQAIDTIFTEMKEVNLMELEIKKLSESVSILTEKANSIRETLVTQLQTISTPNVRDLTNTLQDIYVELAGNEKSIKNINASLPSIKSVDSLRSTVDSIRVLYRQSNDTYMSLVSMNTKEIPDALQQMTAQSGTFIQTFFQYTVPYLKTTVDLSESSPDVIKTLTAKGYIPFAWSYVKQFITSQTQDLYDSTMQTIYDDTLSDVTVFLNKYTPEYVNNQNPLTVQQAISDDLITVFNRINIIKTRSDTFIQAVNKRIVETIKKQYSDLGTQIQTFVNYVAGVSLFSTSYSSYIKTDPNYATFILQLQKANELEATLSAQYTSLSTAYTAFINSVNDMPPDITTRPEINTYLNLYQQTYANVLVTQTLLAPLKTSTDAMNTLLSSTIKETVSILKNAINAKLPLYNQNIATTKTLTAALAAVQPPIDANVVNAFNQSYEALAKVLSDTSALNVTPVDTQSLFANKQALESLQANLTNQNTVLVVLFKSIQKMFIASKNEQLINIINAYSLTA